MQLRHSLKLCSGGPQATQTSRIVTAMGAARELSPSDRQHSHDGSTDGGDDTCSNSSAYMAAARGPSAPETVTENGNGMVSGAASIVFHEGWT